MFKHTIEIPAGEYGRLRIDEHGKGSVQILGDKRLPVDLAKLHPKAWLYFVPYGIGRGLTDGNAPQKFYGKVEKGHFINLDANGNPSDKPVERPVAEREAEALALAEATLAGWYSGETSTPRAGGRISEELRFVRTFITARLVKAGVKASKVPAMPDMESARELATKVGLKWKAIEAALAAHLEALSDDDELTITNL